MRGRAMPKRDVSSVATMRTVETMSSLVSWLRASRKETWIVTGTTASRGDHSIITGCGTRPSSLRELGEEFGVAGMAEAGAVKHALGDRVGDDGAGAAGADVADRLADRGERCRCARGVGLAGRGGRTLAGRNHGQGVGKGGLGFARAHRGDPDLGAECFGALRDQRLVAEQIEGGQVRARGA